VRERGSAAAGEDRRQPSAIDAEGAMPDREYPAVDADKAPGRRPMPYCSRAESERYELFQRDHTVLQARDRRNPPIHVK
jgi:hypothetical protein